MTQQVPVPPAPPAPPPSTLPRYGIATGFSIMDYTNTPLSTVDFELNECQAIGADYIRSDLLNNTQYHNRFDYVLSGCESRGLKMECCLQGTSGPVGASTAASIATAAYNQFGDRCWAYSWVNEPNLGFGSPIVVYTPAQYAAELVAVYNALTALNPNVLVGGGVMGFAGTSQGSYLPEDWWPQVLSLGGAAHFSFVDIHLYDDTTGSNWTDTFNGAIPNEGKPVVVTESGSANANMATRQTVLTHALTDPRPDSICVYSMRNFSDNYGLLDSSNVRRPTWTTVHNIFTAP